MKRLIMLLALVALAVPAIASAAPTASAATCSPTGFFRDGINLTAAKLGGNVTGKLDAAGCDIGVYYGPGSVASVNAAQITNAKYFGVVNYRGNVRVMNSTISQIGNTPTFDGSQHGVGILFTTEELAGGTTSGTATGVIQRNTLSQYQKGGITVRGVGATAQILDNKVTGLGPVDFIAQNGIQVSFGSSAAVLRNTVSGHNYTPEGTESCGLLYYGATGDTSGATNTISNNEMPRCFVDLGVRCVPTGFFRDGINLTAAKLGGNVTGKLDAAGCDIGVYYGPGSVASVNAAQITNAKYFGVVNYRGNVRVMNSTISQIGNTPTFDGSQHGVGILFTTEELAGGTTSGTATGVIQRNTLSQYQKGGITVRGVGATAQILDNKVTGLGPVDFIAQNGIQVSFGSSAAVLRNTVSGHNYTPEGTESCGLLYYGATGDTSGATNTISNNEMPRCFVDLGVRCVPTGFFRDGINLTAAKLGGNVTGKLDAAGCDIGVYYGPGSVASVNAAQITNAKYFGVVNYRGNVRVMNSTISQIGNTPTFDGSQHGVGILFTTEELAGGTTSGTATGVIQRNTLSQYQKGGITVRGVGATAQILDNKVTGLGPVDFIAQNGIQVSFGSSAAVLRNTVSNHFYNGDDEACGLLYYGAAGSTTGAGNTLLDNEENLCVVPR